jgi:hypothetical protein
MELGLTTYLLLSVIFFCVAFLYSSVGHGGASGYLAVLTFFTFAPNVMSSTALALNIIVASIALFAYMRAGHFSWKLSAPFLISSVPLAFVGGMLHVSGVVYNLLLAVALLIAALRLALPSKTHAITQDKLRSPSPSVALATGGSIGLLSGIVGVGGGIFLSPVILFLRWADVKQTAATSAVFIVVNSIAGLLGRAVGQTFEVGSLLPCVFAAAIGGYLGSHYGATKFSTALLRWLLAVVLVIAAGKLLMTLR